MGVESLRQTLATARVEHWGASKTFFEAVKSFFRGHSVSPSESDQARYTPDKGDNGVSVDPLASRKVATSEDGVHYSAASRKTKIGGQADKYPVSPERLASLKEDVSEIGKLARGEVRDQDARRLDERQVVLKFRAMAWVHQYTSKDLQVALQLMAEENKVSPALQLKLEEAAKERIPHSEAARDVLDELYLQNVGNMERFSTKLKDFYTSPDEMLTFIQDRFGDKFTEDGVILKDNLMKEALLYSALPDTNLDSEELFPDAARLYASLQAKYEEQ